ncbi:MAG: hypothetical protein HY761_08635 [Candidatus Omnitrophica bacterium]|nr:hypothetical protein [Candidatus Omnitrophota bacterium]
MNMAKKIVFFLISIIFIVIGCAPDIPKSEYPVEIEKVFNASFDKTWDSVLEIVAVSKGKIITNDKSSGVITYSILDKESESQIYINVYLKALTDTVRQQTVLYFFPKIKTGYLKEIEKDFFEKLSKALGG